MVEVAMTDFTTVPCGFCNARVGERCRGIGRSTHMTRRAIAQQLADSSFDDHAPTKVELDAAAYVLAKAVGMREDVARFSAHRLLSERHKERAREATDRS